MSQPGGAREKSASELRKLIIEENLEYFKGSECDIVIISCVRSYNTNNAAIGFVRNENRCQCHKTVFFIVTDPAVAAKS
jgi:AAA domain